MLNSVLISVWSSSCCTFVRVSFVAVDGLDFGVSSRSHGNVC